MKKEDQKFIESISKYISDNPLNESFQSDKDHSGGVDNDLYFVLSDTINRLENPGFQYDFMTKKAVRVAIVALTSLARIVSPDDENHYLKR